MLPGGKYFNLADMGVSSLVLVLKNPNLNEHRLDEVVFLSRIRIHLGRIPKFEGVPADWLIKLNHLNFLDLLETVLQPYRYFLRGVRFIGFEV